MRPETRAANVSMSHVSPGLNVSLSQCLARSLVSGLWSPPPPCPRQWHATGSPSFRAKPFRSARPRARTKGRAMLRTWQSASKNISVQGKALQKAQPPQKKLFRVPLPRPDFFGIICSTHAPDRLPDSSGNVHQGRVSCLYGTNHSQAQLSQDVDRP